MLHIIFGAVVKYVFVFKILKTRTYHETQVFVPYIRKAEFARMVFISRIEDSVAMRVNVDHRCIETDMQN